MQSVPEYNLDEQKDRHTKIYQWRNIVLLGTQFLLYIYYIGKPMKVVHKGGDDEVHKGEDDKVMKGEDDKVMKGIKS